MDTESRKPYWFPDMPGAIAIVLIVAVVVLAVMLAFRDPGGDMFKFMVGGLMTVGFSSIVAFYFGSSAGSKDKDNAIIGQMAPAKNPPNPPVEPVSPHWWDIVTDEERATITAAAISDAKVNGFMVAAQTGRATSNDLAYLVTKNLLTHDRAAVIQSA